MSESIIRRATAADLPAIVALLADDDLGRERDDPARADDPAYRRAFAEIEADPNQALMVMILGGDVVGCLQLTVLAGLSRRGERRGLVEGVRVASHRRGQRLGERLMAWAIEECRQRGCGVVQLSTDARRRDAHRFYERLGFAPSHLGMKLRL